RAPTRLSTAATWSRQRTEWRCSGGGRPGARDEASSRKAPRSARANSLASGKMSEHAERYRRVAAGCSARVDGIADDQWPAPTPCPRWTVRHLVGHVVSVHRAILGGLDIAPPPPPA